jgi:NAD-dependent SIR2 family protein deacetylase
VNLCTPVYPLQLRYQFVSHYQNAIVSSQTQPTLRISSLLKREVRPILLLGAGASARSGIPVAEDLFTEIIKWGYSVAHARNEGDPTLMRSDWWPWLERQGWFRANTPLSDQYPKAVEAILKPRQDRKTFFQRVTESPDSREPWLSNSRSTDGPTRL